MSSNSRIECAACGNFYRQAAAHSCGESYECRELREKLADQIDLNKSLESKIQELRARLKTLEITVE